MAQLIKQANIFGRLGSGIGQGLADQIPKEIERNRLASGLRAFEQEHQNLTPIQQLSRLSAIPGITPQMIQSFSELARQQAVINSVNKTPNPRSKDFKIEEQLNPNRASATTTASTEAALNPYIPPSGQEQEILARKLLASEPHIYRDIESARNAISSQIAGNVQQSNAKLSKRELENSVQNQSEQKLQEELGTLGAQVPGTVMSRLKQNAVDDVRTKKLSPDEAKVKYGREADAISRSFSNIRSWGGIGLVLNKAKSLFQSIKALQQQAKEGGYQKEAADEMIAENKVSPGFAYAALYPVSDIKPLNEELKSLPNIQAKLEKVAGAPGIAGVGISRPKNANAKALTLEIAPSLARSMGKEGSPLAISYEIERKGYEPEVWKQYLLENKQNLNLTSHQIDELQKPEPSFFGKMNDWWFNSMTGVQ